MERERSRHRTSAHELLRHRRRRQLPVPLRGDGFPSFAAIADARQAPPWVRIGARRGSDGRGLVCGQVGLPAHDSQRTMKPASSEERLLRIAFLAGAITDAAALLPMLIPQLAAWVWGFRDVPGSYRFAMWYG